MNRKFAVIAASSLIAAAGLVAIAEPTKPATGGTTPKSPAAVTLNVVDTAAANPQFKTFVAAVNAAGLADALKGAGPFTVFAPTDAAFAKLPAGTLEDLLKPANKEKLANILKYHVISGEKLTGAQIGGMKESSETLQGSTFQILAKGGKVMIGNDPAAMATITKTDVAATNGVIHVIDTVILPK